MSALLNGYIGLLTDLVLWTAGFFIPSGAGSDAIALAYVYVIAGLSFSLSYLLGSIPFGLLLTRLARQGDIRAIGSGNIGATNVLRTGRKWLALVTLLLDMLKGFIAVWNGYFMIRMLDMAFLGGKAFLITSLMLYTTALLAVIGHMFPVWLRFKGGKGVATALGALLALYLPLGLVSAGLWAMVFAATRISSLSSLVAIAAAPVTAFFTLGPVAAGCIAPISMLILYRHRDNIRRLRAGTEPRFGKKAAA